MYENSHVKFNSLLEIKCPYLDYLYAKREVSRMIKNDKIS